MFFAKNVDSFWRFLPGKSRLKKLTFFWASRPGFYQKSRFWPWLNAHKLSCKTARNWSIYIGYPPPPPSRRANSAKSDPGVGGPYIPPPRGWGPGPDRPARADRPGRPGWLARPPDPPSRPVRKNHPWESIPRSGIGSETPVSEG